MTAPGGTYRPGPCVICRHAADREGALCPRCTSAVYPPLRAAAETDGGATDVGPPAREQTHSAVAPPSPAVRRGPGSTPGYGQLAAKVRAWAREQGIPIGDRGRIPRALVDRYQREHAA